MHLFYFLSQLYEHDIFVIFFFFIFSVVEKKQQTVSHKITPLAQLLSLLASGLILHTIGFFYFRRVFW